MCVLGYGAKYLCSAMEQNCLCSAVERRYVFARQEYRVFLCSAVELTCVCSTRVSSLFVLGCGVKMCVLDKDIESFWFARIRYRVFLCSTRMSSLFDLLE
uniref:Uncharacterized protein n=1 Tax=Trichogramma kaykai TaxID=54128 RepID=A0ABD2WRY9_9HYME